MNINYESVFGSLKDLYGAVGSNLSLNILTGSSLDSVVRNNQLGELVEKINMGVLNTPIPTVAFLGAVLAAAFAASKVNEKYAAPLQVTAGLLTAAGLATYYVTERLM